VSRKIILPVALMFVFALTRIPGMLPQNFSAAYALVFCAGVYFSGRMAWWLPLATLAVTDIALNFYYQSLGNEVWTVGKIIYLVCNYAVYLLIILLGRRFKPQSPFLSLLGGGILGALLFYLITNTASWLFNPFHNPEYTSKTLWSWLRALFIGTAGWPSTWTFFLKTLLSGGLFTGLFVAAMKLTATSESPAEKEAGMREPEAESEPEEAPEEAKA
jgi:hypothetical protein